MRDAIVFPLEGEPDGDGNPTDLVVPYYPNKPYFYLTLDGDALLVDFYIPTTIRPQSKTQPRTSVRVIGNKVEIWGASKVLREESRNDFKTDDIKSPGHRPDYNKESRAEGRFEMECESDSEHPELGKVFTIWHDRLSLTIDQMRRRIYIWNWKELKVYKSDGGVIEHVRETFFSYPGNRPKKREEEVAVPPVPEIEPIPGRPEKLPLVEVPPVPEVHPLPNRPQKQPPIAIPPVPYYDPHPLRQLEKSYET